VYDGKRGTLYEGAGKVPNKSEKNLREKRARRFLPKSDNGKLKSFHIIEKEKKQKVRYVKTNKTL